MQWLFGCVLFPFSPEIKFPPSMFPKAPGWWLFPEAPWPVRLRRGFCSQELDPQRLTKLQLQRGYYTSVPKLKHNLFFPLFFFRKHLLFQDFEDKLFPLLSRSRPFPTLKNAEECAFSCAIFRVSYWFWREGAAPLAGSWFTHLQRRRKEEPRLGKTKLLLLWTSLPFPSSSSLLPFPCRARWGMQQLWIQCGLPTLIWQSIWAALHIYIHTCTWIPFLKPFFIQEKI